MCPGRYWIYYLWGWDGCLAPGSQWIGPLQATLAGGAWSTGFFLGYEKGHRAIRVIREVREGEVEFPHRKDGWYRIKYDPNWDYSYGSYGPKPFVTVAHCLQGQWSGPLFKGLSEVHSAILEVLEEWHEPTREEWEGLLAPCW